MQDQQQEFTSIRDKRISMELNQINNQEELKQYVITKHEVDTGLILRVQIPLDAINQTIAEIDCFFNLSKDKYVKDLNTVDKDKKVEEEKQPGDFKDQNQQQKKAQFDPQYPLGVRRSKINLNDGLKEGILDQHFVFEILLDDKYPFNQPQIFCQTRFTHVIDLYDGKDLYTEILNGEEWRVARNLHEIISCFPQFIEETKAAEDQALEQQEVQEASNLINQKKDEPILTQVFGRYILESVYDLSQYNDTVDENGVVYPSKYAQTCRVFKAKEQDEMDPQNKQHDRFLVVTHTCLLILSKVNHPKKQYLAQLEFWATLQSLERIRRNMNCPNIVALQWRKNDPDIDVQEVNVLQVGEVKQEIDAFIECIVTRMKSMGVAYKKNIKKNYKIAESEVSRSSVAKMDIQNVMLHIESYEEAIEKGDLNIDTIQTLSSVLYPKAIEYFSAFDNNTFNDLLNRMQSLLQREDIQMVLNSVNDSADTPKSTDVPMTNQASSSPPQADPTQNPPPAKPKIDFNVSEEDLAAHKRQMEEEKKAQVASEPPKVAEQPPIVEPVKIDPPKAESPKKEEEKKEEQQPPPTMPAFPSAAPAKDPFSEIKKDEAPKEEKKEEVKVEEQKKEEWKEQKPEEPVFAIGDDSDDD